MREPKGLSGGASTAAGINTESRIESLLSIGVLSAVGRRPNHLLQEQEDQIERAQAALIAMS